MQISLVRSCKWQITRRQKKVYNAVLNVLRASIAGATVGKLHKDWQKEAQAHTTEELLHSPAQVGAGEETGPRQPGLPKILCTASAIRWGWMCMMWVT